MVGIDDKTGRMNPLSYQEVQEATNLLGSIASDSVLPPILIETETVEGGNRDMYRKWGETIGCDYHDNESRDWKDHWC